MKYLALLISLNCSAAQLDFERQPPADWPMLRYHLYLVTADEMRILCPIRQLVYGCAVPLFAAGKCLVFLRENDEQLRNHELWHCIGIDHVGENTMRDAWIKFKGER